MGLFDAFKKKTSLTEEQQKEKQIKNLEAEIKQRYELWRKYPSAKAKLITSIEKLRALVGVEGLSDDNLYHLLRYYENHDGDLETVYQEYSRRFNAKMMDHIDSDLLDPGLDFYLTYLLGSKSENECKIVATPDLDLLMEHAAKRSIEERARAVPVENCIGLFLLELAWNLKEHNYPADTKKWKDRRLWLKQQGLLEKADFPALQYIFVKMMERSEDSFYSGKIHLCTEMMEQTKSFVFEQLWIEKDWYHAKQWRLMRMNLMPGDPDTLLKSFAAQQKEESYEDFVKKASAVSDDYRKAVRMQAQGEREQAYQIMEASANAGYDLARRWLRRQKMLNGELESTDTNALFQRAAERDTSAMLALGEAKLIDSGNVDNEVIAMEWFADAACYGEPKGLLRMGDLYEAGKAGLKKNPKRAAELYLLAAEKHQLLRAWLKYAQVCPEEEILKAYFKVAQSEPADDKDREAVQEAWNKIAIGIVCDRREKKRHDYWLDIDDYDLMTGRMCRAGSAKAETCSKVLYGRTAPCFYGYTMYYLQKNFTRLGKERCEEIAGWARSLLSGDGTHSGDLSLFYARESDKYKGREDEIVYVVHDINRDLEKVKALHGDYDACASVGYYYLTHSDTDLGDEDRRQRRLEEGMTWMIPALNAGYGKAFYYMASAGKYIGLRHEEILSYYDKAIAAGVQDAAERKQLYIDAKKADEKLARDLRRLNRERENMIREAQEANARRLREENESRLNNFERDLNLALYGEAYTNEERGLKLGVDAATGAAIDELHRAALDKMMK